MDLALTDDPFIRYMADVKHVSSVPSTRFSFDTEDISIARTTESRAWLS